MYVIAFAPVPAPKRSSNAVASPSIASCASSSGRGSGRSFGTAERDRMVGYEGLGGGGRATLSRGDGRSVPSPLPSVIPQESAAAEGGGALDDVHSPIAMYRNSSSFVRVCVSVSDCEIKIQA
jgi:hypothetical protein